MPEKCFNILKSQLHSQANSAALLVDRQDFNLYNIAYSKNFGGMINPFSADLGNVDKSVLMYADIDKSAEIDNVAHRTCKLHALL